MADHRNQLSNRPRRGAPTRSGRRVPSCASLEDPGPIQTPPKFRMLRTSSERRDPVKESGLDGGRWTGLVRRSFSNSRELTSSSSQGRAANTDARSTVPTRSFALVLLAMGLSERRTKQKIGNDPRNLAWSQGTFALPPSELIRPLEPGSLETATSVLARQTGPKGAIGPSKRRTPFNQLP